MVQHLAKDAVAAEEHRRERKEEKGVANISDGDAEGVGIEGEQARSGGFVVSGLIETNAFVGDNSIHRNGLLLALVAVDKGDVRGIVCGSVGAGMIGHGEVVELYGERKGVFAGFWMSVGSGEGAHRLFFAYRNGSLASKESGDAGT